MVHFFPQDLITQVLEEDKTHSITNTLTDLDYSENGKAQITKKKMSSEENPAKGIHGIRDLFASTNSNQDAEKLETLRKQSIQREDTESIDRPSEIPVDNQVETDADNSGTLDATTLSEKTLREYEQIKTLEKLWFFEE